MARNSGPRGPIDNEIMAFRLAGHGLVDCGMQKRVGRAGPHGLPEIRGVLLPEAHIECAGTCDSDPVAGLAEIVSHRRDEAEPAPCLRDAHISGRPPGPIRSVLELSLIHISEPTR